MEFLFEYGLFFAKIATVVIAIVGVLVLAKALNGRHGSQKGELEVIDLTEQYKDTVEQLESHLFDKALLKARDKADKKSDKEHDKARQNEIKQAVKNGNLTTTREPRLFVIDFHGSIDAREVSSLRQEISAILAIAIEGDEVLLRLETGGGMVHAYGLASSQLDRLKAAGITLTIAVDKVAASGGYMMACVADKIVSAPFAIVGSIGVIAQLPNFSKVLKKNDIEFEQITAGEFKRTLTMFGENSDKAREKFKEEIEETHGLFKQFIAVHRPDLDLNKVATGEHWFGQQALELGLVDQISTSDDLITEACKAREVLQVKYVRRKKLIEKLSGASSEAADTLLMKWVARGQRPFM
ncbi:protease SohB [Photobacterium aquimaris]|uniref:Protease SohB n=1 Tax=Photobacterium aquimaris TaxID=512643 RepID=A0A2T3ISS7_9GAMM|nr:MULTISPECIES: protease SohB [Photobacterium]OBU18572.1 protease SohB [Photobacterium aquimaris]OBU20993.1 protease SohB [Photobacterium aquimaris]PSU31400.1 protease SohB [Photobacterium aquimaris]PSW03084.1 protease SohB [Photobacterium aquimaris]